MGFKHNVYGDIIGPSHKRIKVFCPYLTINETVISTRRDNCGSDIHLLDSTCRPVGIGCIGGQMSLTRVVAVGKASHIHELARQVGSEVYAADNIVEAIEIVQTANPELILFDHQYGRNGASEFIEQVNRSSNAPIIILNGSEEHASVLAKLTGIGDCRSEATKNTRADARSPQATPRADDVSLSGSTDNKIFAADFAALISIVGRSKAMKHTIRMIELVASSRCNPILVVGETGTGKELAAKAVHLLRHPNEPFIAVNCAALTANLLESELFGHAKGSFTGASCQKTGLLELAGSGTLFLDEISEMPLDLQAKLLRVLQEKTFRRVGGTGDVVCDATIIASSNRNLLKEVQENRFRRDLYYRLNISPITMPPLASPGRREDIPLLADYFLKNSKICPDKSGKITSLTSLAMETLTQYSWPGNVRELHNVIERAILLETTDKIGLSSIVIDPTECTEASCNAATEKFKDLSLASAERELISRALQETGWQKTRAAALLGITRATLYAKVKQYNIERGSYVAKATDFESENECTDQPLAVTA